MMYEEVMKGHAIARNCMTWGTYGKSGDKPFKRIKICELSNEHLAAILDTQVQIWDDETLVFVLIFELGYRAGNGIVIEDTDYE